jgi:hypothetical protein
MKECAVNRERAVAANHQMAEVAEPREGAFDFPASSITSQRSSNWVTGLLRFQRCGAIRSIPRTASGVRSGSLS